MAHFYDELFRAAERKTRPIRAEARRIKSAFSQFDIFGQASKIMGQSTEAKKGAPNYGRKRK